MNNKLRPLGITLLYIVFCGIHAGCDNGPDSPVVETQWEVAAGPYGGDRKSVVIDPQDPTHAITDSVDSSGIWELRDGRWTRASPEGAPFFSTSTRVYYLLDPSNQSDWVLVAKSESRPTSTPLLFRVPLANPSAGPVVPVSWDGGVSMLDSYASAGASRIFVVDLALHLPNVQQRLQAGLWGFSSDGGRNWTRRHIDGLIHIPTQGGFASDGSVLIASGVKGSAAAFLALVTDVGPERISDAIEAYMSRGVPLPPEYLAPYGIEVTNQILRVDFQTGAVLATSASFADPFNKITTSQTAPDIVWAASRTQLLRSEDNGASFTAVPVQTASKLIQPGVGGTELAGLTVTAHPGTASETIFISFDGANGQDRGIYRGSRGNTGEWLFTRVSPGPSAGFLDWPKASVVFASSNRNFMYAPYAEDGMWISNAFGEPGSFAPMNHGLTGYNVFDVKEDPGNVDRIFAAAQNVIRVNEDRIASAQWDDRFISLGGPTANVRGGVQVDPMDPKRWLAGAGGGAAGNLNGGVWLTLDAGMTWQKVLGSTAAGSGPSNPQVVEMLQHPHDPDWVLAASVVYWGDSGVAGGGNAGVFSSTQRGDSGTWVEVVDQGDAWVLLPLADGRVLAGGKWGLSLLSRNGSTVNVNPVPGSWPGESIRAAAQSGADFLIGMQSGKIYRGNVSGGWTQAGTIPGSISDMAASPLRPNEVYVATDYTGGPAAGVWRTTDGGGSWQDFSAGLESSEIVVFDLQMSKAGDRLYAGTLGGLAVRKLPQ